MTYVRVGGAAGSIIVRAAPLLRRRADNDRDFPVHVKRRGSVVAVLCVALIAAGILVGTGRLGDWLGGGPSALTLDVEATDLVVPARRVLFRGSTFVLEPTGTLTRITDTGEDAPSLPLEPGETPGSLAASDDVGLLVLAFGGQTPVAISSSDGSSWTRAAVSAGEPVHGLNAIVTETDMLIVGDTDSAEAIAYREASSRLSQVLEERYGPGWSYSRGGDLATATGTWADVDVGESTERVSFSELGLSDEETRLVIGDGQQLPPSEPRLWRRAAPDRFDQVLTPDAFPGAATSQRVTVASGAAAFVSGDVTWVSTNGLQWSHLGSGDVSRAGQLAVTLQGTFLTTFGDDAKLLRADDVGGPWTPVNLEVAADELIVVSASNDNGVVLVGTKRGSIESGSPTEMDSFIHYSADGRTWRTIGPSMLPALHSSSEAESSLFPTVSVLDSQRFLLTVFGGDETPDASYVLTPH